MKKLEKKLVHMQIEERDLELTEENQSDLYGRLNPEKM